MFSPDGKSLPDPRHSTDSNPEHEGLCTQCGKCCYKKVIIGPTVFITPFPCEFLDTQTNLCTVYEERFEKNPFCLNVNQGMQVSAFPEDCGYVPKFAPPGYKPAVEAWSWKGRWREFDAYADDLDVSAKTREKVRARGPEAPPEWIEANERIKREREARGLGPNDPVFWGEKQSVVDLARQNPAPEQDVPRLSDLLKRGGRA